jgi:inhibitor of KinA sporulation pathway (predicted exonuclease)
MDSREVTRDIRHDIAEALDRYGVQWSGLHDNAIDSPIERHVRPLVQELERYRKALEEIDRCTVGGYENDLGEIEACDSCGEMRTIAENALAAPAHPTPAREEA